MQIDIFNAYGKKLATAHEYEVIVMIADGYIRLTGEPVELRGEMDGQPIRCLYGPDEVANDRHVITTAEQDCEDHRESVKAAKVIGGLKHRFGHELREIVNELSGEDKNTEFSLRRAKGMLRHLNSL